MEKSWKAAILRVLRESGQPLHYRDISDTILDQGYYQTEGATPADTVNAQISHSIKHQGQDSPFVRVAPGIFALNPLQAPLPAAPAPTPRAATQNPATLDERDVQRSEPIVRAFGMYWERRDVVWKTAPRLLGKQHDQSAAVDFGAQKGIYILYDHHTPIYVGRSIDRPLGQRLWEHTTDRLKSRWNRFSWFGLLSVMADGALEEKPLALTLASQIATLEAVLIEAMEPPQNRRRGDDLSVAEFIQAADPALRERDVRQWLSHMQHTLLHAG